MRSLFPILAGISLANGFAAVAAEVPTTAYTWKNVKVGAGGYAPGIIFSTAEQGLAYLRTDMGGAYRWDRTVSRWIPLQDAFAEGSFFGIESLAADPHDPNVVYLAAGMYRRAPAAILRSGDRGRTWQIFPVPFRMGGNEDGRGLGERLAIDPYRRSTLFFGSRHDGLQRSNDAGRTWRMVESFPWRGRGEDGQRTHAGISFVLFDPGARGRVYAAVADRSAQHLFRSDDGGETWQPVPHEPPTNLLPVKAAVDGKGQLYVAYSSSMGPNDIENGAVWTFDPGTSKWTDITPAPQAREGGFMGVAVDPRRAGRVAVSSIDRWKRGDSIWLSDNGGKSWTSLRERSTRDVRASPFLRWGGDEAEFGHWISGLAFDPFDAGALAYTTGATVYRSDAIHSADVAWQTWVEGVEQTAIISLTSPAAGAPLISGFGDISGFVHEDLTRSPASMHGEPRMTNTNGLDYAGADPRIIVRWGSLRREEAQDVSIAWSVDGGRIWKPLRVPPMSLSGAAPSRFDLRGEAPVALSADGEIFVVSTPTAMATSDRGATWRQPHGLPAGARVIADKADPRLFYALDFTGSRLFVSEDRARSFQKVPATGLPADLKTAAPRNRESPSTLLANTERAGELWLLVNGRLYRSIDAARSFQAASPPDLQIRLFGLGKSAAGERAPTVYAAGSRAGLQALWRSTDGGATWTRINDDEHQWGLRFRVLTGDPKTFGRVYLGTDGRGILYGDPATRHTSP